MNAPFGIYVHWPFCAAKCPYCDFNSHVRRQGVDEKRYSDAFHKELGYMAKRSGQKQVSTIFLGGGTPSLMSVSTVSAILDSISQYFSLADDVEITLEANPSSVEAERFQGYRKAGVNRLSLGVQSLEDSALKRLGRLHDVKQALYAIELARQIFPRLSFDLIYTRPEQSLSQWEGELNRAIDLAADHLSLYQLTIEEGTPFKLLYAHKKLILPDDDMAARFYQLTQEVTDARGLPAYEISNHAAQGAYSRHNLIYWRYQQYIGVGPGAHGRFLEPSENGWRTVTICESNPEAWLKEVEQNGHGICQEERINRQQQGDEMLLMGLRLSEGLDVARYETLSQRRLPQERLASLQQLGLVEALGNSKIKATAKGRIVLDYVIGQLAQ